MLSYTIEYKVPGSNHLTHEIGGRTDKNALYNRIQELKEQGYLIDHAEYGEPCSACNGDGLSYYKQDQNKPIWARRTKDCPSCATSPHPGYQYWKRFNTIQ